MNFRYRLDFFHLFSSTMILIQIARTANCVSNSLEGNPDKDMALIIASKYILLDGVGAMAVR